MSGSIIEHLFSPGVFCNTSTAGVHSNAVALSSRVQLQGSNARVALLPVHDDADAESDEGSDACTWCSSDWSPRHANALPSNFPESLVKVQSLQLLLAC